jgi:hypothetical protein
MLFYYKRDKTIVSIQLGVLGVATLIILLSLKEILSASKSWNKYHLNLSLGVTSGSILEHEKAKAENNPADTAFTARIIVIHACKTDWSRKNLFKAKNAKPFLDVL